MDERTVAKLNSLELDPQVKILAARAMKLVEETTTRQKLKGLDTDWVYRMQLKDDIKAVEKCLKQLSKGKLKKQDQLITELEKDVVKLKTSSEAILGWQFED